MVSIPIRVRKVADFGIGEIWRIYYIWQIKKEFCFICDKTKSEVKKLLKGKFANICDIRDRFNRQQTSVGQIKKYLEVNYGFTVVSKQYKEKRKYVRYWVIKKFDNFKNQVSIRPP